MFAVGFLHQVLQLLSVHCSETCKNAKIVADAGMKDLQEESFSFSFSLTESTVVGLRRFVTSLSRLQGSH